MRFLATDRSTEIYQISRERRICGCKSVGVWLAPRQSGAARGRVAETVCRGKRFLRGANRRSRRSTYGRSEAERGRARRRRLQRTSVSGSVFICPLNESTRCKDEKTDNNQSWYSETDISISHAKTDMQTTPHLSWSCEPCFSRTGSASGSEGRSSRQTQQLSRRPSEMDG